MVCIISTNALPLFQYSLDCPPLNMTKLKKNRGSEPILPNWITEEYGSAPQYLSIERWTTKKALVLHTLEDEFIIRPSYIDITYHISTQCDKAVVDIFTSVRYWGRQICTHLWKREFANFVIREWNLKNTMIATVLFFIKLEGDTHCFFNQGFGPLWKVKEYENRWCLGLFLLELKRHRQKLLRTTIQPHKLIIL